MTDTKKELAKYKKAYKEAVERLAIYSCTPEKEWNDIFLK